ncbi:MAG: hypothetical protein HZB33_07020 [Nitrospirae bacterium]|nr:hypothetical protein [Nitrospirota bacterium]
MDIVREGGIRILPVKLIALILVVFLLIPQNILYAEDDPVSGSGGQIMGIESPLGSLESIVESVIDDALDFLPKATADQIAPGGDLDALMDAALNVEASESGFLGSADPASLGAQAAHIVNKVYGEGRGKDWSIPQTIFFERIFIGPDTVDMTIARLKRGLESSKNIERDKYNICLNAVVNLWIENLSRNDQVMHRKPKEGVYLRDAENTLYAYEEGEK